jgi:hypothetical protein
MLSYFGTCKKCEIQLSFRLNTNIFKCLHSRSTLLVQLCIAVSLIRRTIVITLVHQYSALACLQSLFWHHTKQVHRGMQKKVKQSMITLSSLSLQSPPLSYILRHLIIMKISSHAHKYQSNNPNNPEHKFFGVLYHVFVCL